MFPSSLPSLSTPTSSETLQAGGHTALHVAENSNIVAIATKLGIGTSTPTSTSVLVGNGTGTSTWGQVALSNMVTGILPTNNGGTGISSLGSGVATFLNNPTSANLAAALPDETGTGAAVFANSPTINYSNNSIPAVAIVNNSLTSSQLSNGAVTAPNIGTDSSFAWTTYVPTLTGFSGTTINTARYTQMGKTVTVVFDVSGTSNATTFTLTVPVAAKLTSNIYFEGFLSLMIGSGGTFAGPGKIFLDPSSSTTVASLFIDNAGSLWSSSGSKGARGTLIYEAV